MILHTSKLDIVLLFLKTKESDKFRYELERVKYKTTEWIISSGQIHQDYGI